MAIPKQVGVPDRIPIQDRNQLEIAQVAVTMEGAVRTVFGGYCIRMRANCGKDSKGEFGQNHVRITNDINGGQSFSEIVSSAKGSMA